MTKEEYQENAELRDKGSRPPKIFTLENAHFALQTGVVLRGGV